MGAAPVRLTLVALLLAPGGSGPQALAHGGRRREVEALDVDGRQRTDVFGHSHPLAFGDGQGERRDVDPQGRVLLGWIDKNSRKSQAEFVCSSCNFTCNADTNAAANVAAGQGGIPRPRRTAGAGGTTPPTRSKNVREPQPKPVGIPLFQEGEDVNPPPAARAAAPRRHRGRAEQLRDERRARGRRDVALALALRACPCPRARVAGREVLVPGSFLPKGERPPRRRPTQRRPGSRLFRVHPQGARCRTAGRTPRTR